MPPFFSTWGLRRPFRKVLMSLTNPSAVFVLDVVTPSATNIAP